MKIIISIDGGGVRGIVPAAVLAYLEKKIQEIQKDDRIKIGNLVDFVAGTSTGSIITAAMLIPEDSCQRKVKRACPKYKMDEIVQMYFDMGDQVFEKKFWHQLKTVWGLFGPTFPASNIEPLLLKELGHYKLSDLIKPMMITGYDIEKRRVNFYTNTDKNKKYEDYYVKDVVRGSTSIPAYFPPARFNHGVDINTIVDGGVFANNPSLAAFIEVSKTLFDEGFKDVTAHDVMVISLGTGYIQQKPFPYDKSKKWGKAQWMMPVIDVLLSSHSEVTDYEMRKIFNSYNADGNYKRLNPPIILGDSSGLNGSKDNLTNLLKDVQRYINENKTMLNTLAREIIDINCLFTPDC